MIIYAYIYIYICACCWQTDQNRGFPKGGSWWELGDMCVLSWLYSIISVVSFCRFLCISDFLRCYFVAFPFLLLRCLSPLFFSVSLLVGFCFLRASCNRLSSQLRFYKRWREKDIRCRERKRFAAEETEAGENIGGCGELPHGAGWKTLEATSSTPSARAPCAARVAYPSPPQMADLGAITEAVSPSHL